MADDKPGQPSAEPDQPGPGDAALRRILATAISELHVCVSSVDGEAFGTLTWDSVDDLVEVVTAALAASAETAAVR